MSTRICVAFLCIALVALSGCVTTPAPAEGVTSAYAVGDRARAAFDEVVVSLPMYWTDASVGQPAARRGSW